MTVFSPTTFNEGAAPGIAADELNKLGTQAACVLSGSMPFTGIPDLPPTGPTTDNQAVRKAYVDTRAVTSLTMSASDTLKNSNDATKSTPQYVGYTKVKEMRLNGDLVSVRVKFQMSLMGGGGVPYGRIYKNGVAIGTERSTENAFSEDFVNLVAGDLIQIYACNNPGIYATYILNMRLCYTYDYKITTLFGLPLTTAIPLTGSVSVTNQDP